MSFERIDLEDGFSLYYLPTKKFKATTLSLFIHRPLDNSVTRNALLLRILPRGCKKYPNLRKIIIFLESLYGAGFSTGLSKIGERHILHFQSEIVNERFLPHTKAKAKGTQKILDFFKRLIAEPVVEDDGFKKDYFEEEQINLRHLIKGLIDDKITYAQERCIAEMCKDEPFGLYEYGKLDDLDKITPRNLLAHLQEVLLTSPIDIYAVGDIDAVKLKKQVLHSFARILALRRRARQQGRLLVQIPAPTAHVPPPAEPKIIKETMPVDQAKLVMGFRTGINWSDETIYPLIVFNNLLGVHPNSRLFQTVREKAGLAYYVSSHLEPSKGLMFIQAGINSDQFQKTVDIIKTQITDIAQGNITGTEFQNTIKALEERLVMMEDSPSSLISYFLELIINRRAESLEGLRTKFQQVMPESIAAVARQVKLDTIYYLTQ